MPKRSIKRVVVDKCLRGMRFAVNVGGGAVSAIMAAGFAAEVDKE
jgi:hypothetical protein